MSEPTNLGKFIGYFVSAFALITIGFTIGTHWTTRSRPGIVWRPAPAFDIQWELIDAGDTAQFIDKLNTLRPKPEHIIPVCGGNVFRVWCRKDQADVKYKEGYVTGAYFDSPQTVSVNLSDPNRVVIGFTTSRALYYVQVLPK